MRSPPALVCWSVLFAVSGPALCAQASGLQPGARIRFDARSLGDRITGTLVARESDTLVVSADGDPEGLVLIVPVDSVSRIDVGRMRPLTAEGAVVGLLGGTLLALLASPDWVDENGDCTTIPCLAYKVSPHLDTRVAVLGVAGALLGAIAGSQTRTASWASVPLERLNVGPAPEGGFALGVRITF